MGRSQEVLTRILADTGGHRPHYERYCLLAIPATIQELFGLDRGQGLKGELGLPEADKVVQILVDGLGYLQLEALRAAGLVDLSPFTEDGEYLPLTSVFPPTTTTALASLSTGRSPIVHGVLGYKLFLQDPGAVVNVIKLATPGAGDNSLEKLGIKAEDLLPIPTFYRNLADAGVGTVLFLPKYIMDSGLSHVLYQGVAETVPFISLSDLFMLLWERLSQPGRSLFGVYYPTTDTLAHRYGPGSPACTTEVVTFFRLLGEFLPRARGAVLLVTADHGFYEIDPERDVVFCQGHQALRRGLLLPPVGDSRAAYLFLRRGHEQHVRDFFAHRFPHDFLVLSPEEALARKLWGLEEAGPEARARLGDLVVLSQGRRLLVWEREFRLRGMHGGLTQEELLVPLLAKAL